MGLHLVALRVTVMRLEGYKKGYNFGKRKEQSGLRKNSNLAHRSSRDSELLPFQPISTLLLTQKQTCRLEKFVAR